MDVLWAPWRIEYLQGPKPGECIFCLLEKIENDRESLVLWRGKSVFCVMNRYPYNPGHLMLVPYQHAADLSALGTTTQTELMSILSVTVDIVKRVLNAEGVNCGMNLGQVAGAGIKDHLHFHVVPRWGGDCNFLPILGETRSMPEYLDETYSKLAPAFAELMGE